MPKKQKPILSREEKIKLKQQKIEKEFKKKKSIIKYKKFAKIIGVLLFILIIGSIVFYIRKKITEPSLEQKVQKTVEAPPPDFKIKTKQVEVLQSSPLRCDVLAQIVNNNLNWGVPRLTYKINLKDKNNLLVGQKQGNTFILPDQTKSIIELGIETQNQAVSAAVELEIKDTQKLKASPKLIFKTENINYQDLGDKSKISATLINQTPFGFNEVIINTLVYDKNKKLQGLNFTTINDFSSNTKRDFSVFWRKKLAVKKPEIIIETYVNPFETTPFLDIYKEEQPLEY